MISLYITPYITLVSKTNDNGTKKVGQIAAQVRQGQTLRYST
jgi:hypothetical protein